MKLNKQGVHFKYHGDNILRYWPWENKGKPRYHSQMFSRDFNSFNEYWEIVGRESLLIKSALGDKKLVGIGYLDIISFWTRITFPGEVLVILTNVDPERKGPSFWSRLTIDQKNSMIKDVVVLRCSDRKEMMTLVDSVDSAFADAAGLLDGEFIYSNQRTAWYFSE